MKIVDESSALCIFPGNLFRGVLTSVKPPMVRKHLRSPKMITPHQLIVGKQRHSWQEESLNKRGIKSKKPATLALAAKENVQKAELENFQVFTPQELARFEEIDRQREMLENRADEKMYEVAFDCELYFPEEEEEF